MASRPESDVTQVFVVQESLFLSLFNKAAGSKTFCPPTTAQTWIMRERCWPSRHVENKPRTHTQTAWHHAIIVLVNYECIYPLKSDTVKRFESELLEDVCRGSYLPPHSPSSWRQNCWVRAAVTCLRTSRILPVHLFVFIVIILLQINIFIGQTKHFWKACSLVVALSLTVLMTVFTQNWGFSWEIC